MPRKKKGLTIDDLQKEFLSKPDPKVEEVKEPVPTPITGQRNVEGLLEDLKEMTDDQMLLLLKEFFYSYYWVAYKKYVEKRMTVAEESLFSLDPYRQATEIARNQGFRSGIFDLERFVFDLISKKEEN